MTRKEEDIQPRRIIREYWADGEYHYEYKIYKQ